MWGGQVEMIVHRQKNNHKINKYSNCLRLYHFKKASTTTAHSQEFWTGIMMGTVLNEAESSDFKTLFQLWKPVVAIIAVPSSIPAKTRRSWVTSFSGTLRLCYVTRDISCSHNNIGGVTTSKWNFYHLSRYKELGGISKQAIMMAPQFSRSLQTALQDTIGGTKWKTDELDKTSMVAPLQGINIMGYILEGGLQGPGKLRRHHYCLLGDTT